MKTLSFIFSLLLCLAWFQSLHAAIIRVPQDQATISAATAAAQQGDVIQVAPGTYTETAAVDLHTSYVTLTSTGNVILRAPSSADAVLNIGSRVIGAAIQNFTIDRPSADSNWMRCVQINADTSATFTNCKFSGPANGVGIILFGGSDLTVTSCTFGNFVASASWAGAISIEAPGATFSNITVQDSIFNTGCNRWLTTTGGTPPRIGAVNFRRNVCKAAQASQPIYFVANTAYDATQDLVFEDCSFQGNLQETAEFHYTNAGGPKSLQLHRCEFKAYDGLRRVMYLDIPTAVTFDNVLIAGGKHEGLIRVWGGPTAVSLYHCTLVNDGVTTAQAVSGTAGSTFIDGWDGGRTFQVRDCLFYSPTAYTPGFSGDAGSSANRIYNIDYSIVQHPQPAGAKVTLTTGANYSTAAINFNDAANRNYRLGATSPAINAGTPVSSMYQLDLARNPRKLGNRLDIGAYEYPQTPRTLNVPANYATLELALDDAGGSDTIQMAAGTYTAATFYNIVTGFVTIKGSGVVNLRAPSSADAVVNIAPGVIGLKFDTINVNRPTADNDWRRCVQAQGYSATQFVNCGISGAANGVGVILFNGADGTFQNCTFGDFNPASSWAGAISLEYSDNKDYSNVLVDGCTFNTGCNKWIAVTGSIMPHIGALTLRNSTFNAAVARAALSLASDVVYDPTQEILIEDCTFEGTILELAEFFYTSKGGPKAFTMRRDTIKAYDSLRKIIWLDLPCPVLFENLLIAGGKHETLIRIWGGPSSVTFQHCTLVNDGVTAGESESGLNGSTLVDGWDSGRTFVVRNSLLYTPANYTGALAADSSAAGTRIYDVDYSIVNAPQPAGTNAFLQAGAHYGTESIGFVDAANRNYHLSSTSPARDAGIDLGILLDLAKNARNQGAAPDLGVYESNGTAPSAARHWTLY
jgi:hypothetical protein